MPETGSTIKPLVSITMPVYNASRYIRQTIESVLAQTYTNWELILVNDGSTDDSAAIIASYTDPRIRYFENPANMGIVPTRNRCAELATGKYIAVLDNDDIIYPEKLEAQVNCLEAQPELGLCAGNYVIIDSEGHQTEKIWLDDVAPLTLKTKLLFSNMICNSTVMLRAGLLKNAPYVSGYDMTEDYVFLLKVAHESGIRILPDYLTQYRIHGTNTSLKKINEMRMLREKIDGFIFGYLGITPSPEEAALHSAFISGVTTLFNDPAQLQLLENWLLKLYTHIKNSRAYDPKEAAKILSIRWIRLQQKLGIARKTTLINKLSGRFPASYLSGMFSLVKSKLTGKALQV